ncbi:O-antigen ligase [Sphingomonas sp. LHG3406-1]|uniref:O-antigen ligase family protein n=1 Tax=Sphingomonas sp. LHG3406-1 TaxID=2804617 RepID=UPI0026133A52|nr:O-antigen ligase family protein [Sphingomonas sp. LHG3406-1]
MSQKLRHAIVPAFLFCCLLLGGSPQGFWRYFALQLGGLLLIGWALVSTRKSHPTLAAKQLLWLGLLWFGLVLVQLVPLPPGLWSSLPGREPLVSGFVLRGEALPWLPLSMTPATTLDILPMMAVPLGMVVGVVLLGAYRARWCIVALALGTVLSVLLGALQLSQGGPYLYPHSNTGVATGLFANGNHQATLLLASIPFLAALIGRERRGRKKGSSAVPLKVIAGGTLVLVLLGVALNGSLAALGLLAPVLLASVGIALPKLRRGARIAAGAGLALLAAGALGLATFTDAGGSNSSIASRSEIYGHTLAAIGDSFPVGIGLGAFASYYRLYEDPAAVTSVFINHAHSDPLEWLLETGLIGGILLVLLLGWWAVQALRLWRAEQRDLVALAATVASAAILAHSLVDYPLRDAAIQAVFALCLAFMAEPRSHAQRSGERTRGQRPPRHLTLDDEAEVSG